MNGSKPVVRRVNYASTELVRPVNQFIAVEGDPFPEVADQPEGYGYDPDLPAVRTEYDVTKILCDIRDAVQKMSPTKNPPYWMLYSKIVPGVANGEFSIVDNNNFRYIFVANAPRIVQVYAGMGKSLYLGEIPVGKSLSATIPFTTDGVTVTWQSNNAGVDQYIVVVLSSEKLEVDIK